jgi:hypothetical protein
MLTVVFAQKVFVQELVANSVAIGAINDQFRDRSTKLQLISFYESDGMGGVGVFLTGFRVLIV